MALDVYDIEGQVALLSGIPTVPPVLKLLRDQTGMSFVGIARVTRERWVLCSVLDEGGFGLSPGDELDVNTTLCVAQLDKPATIAFDDARRDPTYFNHQAPRLYGFRSHISAAIHLADGSYFGSLCALDARPVSINTERSIGMVEGLAALIGRLLDDELLHGWTMRELADEKATGISREQFLAVVAHDIRNPLSTMHNSSSILERSNDTAIRKVGAMLHASAGRMSGLVDDLVDFARGRAGISMPVRLAGYADIDVLMEAVIQEARDGNPGREIRASLNISCPVRCDPERLQQMLSNLIGNALTYGATDMPITVETAESKGVATLVVTNWGAPIADHQLARVFDAYARDSVARDDASMGLGLHICQLIAVAHGGKLSVTSDAQLGTRFEMSWPSACDEVSDSSHSQEDVR